MSKPMRAHIPKHLHNRTLIRKVYIQCTYVCICLYIVTRNLIEAKET